MSAAVPQVPPRPTRSQEQTTAPASSEGSDIPRIPPRPINRRLERSMSPHRESYARSPLNEAPALGNHGAHGKSGLYASGSANASSPDIPRRPSSVVLPSIGQEGNEYAEVFGVEELGTSPPQARNIANDLKLHAPKPSLPTSSAKERVSAVTRTDSGQAAAFGIGKATSVTSVTSDDKDAASRQLKTKASFTSQNSASNGTNGTERPPSSLDGEHGIPEIGQRVPMYPNAGDVQAPSPAPFAQPFEKGIGFHNDGSKPRHHGRRTSGRGHDIPPDAYGRYGHGVVPHDRFEKAYYEKHPELFKKEIGQYGEGRPEWALSSEDLNKIVRDTASRGTEVGKSPAARGTPTEQIGFQATEEYASRISSPRLSGFQVAHSNASDTHVDSTLRNESSEKTLSKSEFEKTLSTSEFEKTLSRSLNAPSDLALASEDDDDVIHVDEPGRRISRIYGGAGDLDSTEDLGPHTGHGGEEDGIHDELGYSAPILASDEVAKEPFGWELQPAVSPMAASERRGSSDFYNFKSGSATSLSNSRPSSRPGSIHGTLPGLRLPENTHLEMLDEYEPLFPEEVKGGAKPKTVADKVKGRPELKNRKFPSQDIWEDSPNSLQYTATVSTPQLPEDNEDEKAAAPRDETPAQAFARKQEELAERESKSADSFLAKEKKPWTSNPALLAETRPGIKQRFPSRDIWEDSPDSLQLQTTVGSPQIDDKDVLSPPDERPTTGAVAYHQEKAAAGLPLGSEEGRATTGIGSLMKPSIPTRPVKSKLSGSPEKEQPAIPERPARTRQVPPAESASPPIPFKTKPQVPARPSKPITRDSSEHVPLSTVASNSSARSIGSDQGAAAASKPKPPPPRPMGSKIAALQGGFMSDLNKRLQLGPQAPKKEEPAPEEVEEVKEKAPLVDARKGRARGPARRAPAKSPAPSVEPPAEKSSTLAFSVTSTWEIDPEEGHVRVSSSEREKEAPVASKAADSETPTLATNIAGQAVHEPSEITEKSVSPPSAVEETHVEQTEELKKPEIVTESHEPEIPKSKDEPPVISQSTLAPEPTEGEDMAGSTATLKPEPVQEKENVEE